MSKAATHKNWKYDLHPSVRMVQSVIAGMEQKTGHSLEDWLRLVKKEGPTGEKDRSAWLKKEHGFTTNYAGWVAERSDGGGTAEAYDPDALVILPGGTKIPARLLIPLPYQR